jgi:Ca-activated chloride channel family protein
MLLITDGEDNEDRGLEAARNAARQGVKIFIFGIGEPAGGPVPAGSEKGGFTKDRDGKLVLSKLDERTLQDLASATGGGYVRSVAGDLDLDMLYFEGVKQKTEAQTLKSGKIKIYEERFNVFILAALLLLLVEELLEDKCRPASRSLYRSRS